MTKRGRLGFFYGLRGARRSRRGRGTSGVPCDVHGRRGVSPSADLLLPRRQRRAFEKTRRALIGAAPRRAPPLVHVASVRGRASPAPAPAGGASWGVASANFSPQESPRRCVRPTEVAVRHRPPAPMAAYLQWRRFAFFDREPLTDSGGNLVLLPPGIVVCDSGRGSLVFGDILPWLRSAGRWRGWGPGAASGVGRPSVEAP